MKGGHLPQESDHASTRQREETADREGSDPEAPRRSAETNYLANRTVADLDRGLLGLSGTPPRLARVRPLPWSVSWSASVSLAGAKSSVDTLSLTGERKKSGEHGAGDRAGALGRQGERGSVPAWG